MGKSVSSFLFSWLLAQTVFAQTYSPRFQRAEWQFSWQNQYHQVLGNFSGSGNSFDNLPKGYGFRYLTSRLNVESTINRHLQIGAFLQGTYAEAENPTERKTNSGPDSAGAIVRLAFATSQLRFIPEVSLSAPLAQYDEQSLNTQFTEGAINGTGQMWLIVPMGAHALTSRLGFTYRDRGRSSQLPYGFGLDFRFKSFSFGTELQGYTTVGVDQVSENDSARTLSYCRNQGCAKTFGAINPSRNDLAAFFTIHPGSTWRTTLGIAGSLTGQASSVEYSGHIKVAIAVARAKPKSSEPVYRPTTRGKAPPPKFEEEIDDGVDQDLFEPDTPSIDADPNLD